MATGLVDIANNAGGRFGGFGDQLDGSGRVTAAQLTADDDAVSNWINEKYPVVRKKVITDFAAMKAPFKETQKFASLGPDLKTLDFVIAAITVSSTVVNIETKEDHNRETGDTAFLAEIEATENNDITGTLITSLNGTTVTVTKVDDTNFTIDTAGVDATWLHEPDTGIVSYVPEIGPYAYAFNLPGDFFTAVRQTDETTATHRGTKTEYQYRFILNKDGNGFLWLTNRKTNKDGDSAYIEYCIDQETFTLFSPGFEEALAMLLAAELCPNLGRDEEVRQRLLGEYHALTIVESKRNNLSQYDTEAHVPTNYLGNRSKRITSL